MPYRRGRRRSRGRRSLNTIRYVRGEQSDTSALADGSSTLAIRFRGSPGYITQIVNLDFKLLGMSFSDATTPLISTGRLSYDIFKVDSELQDTEIAALPILDKRIYKHRVANPGMTVYGQAGTIYSPNTQVPFMGGYRVRRFARLNGQETEHGIRLQWKGSTSSDILSFTWVATYSARFIPAVGLQ